MKEAKSVFENRVKGQDFAINKTLETIKSSIMGLNGIISGGNNRKPKGILFFAGSTGVGKTELAKSIAEFVFGDESRLIRFDMSEFTQEHSDQRLIGAPPGYVGFDGGGELTNKVKENPYSILLFDEVEKAHPKILDKFLQILEDGRLTSSQGELIDFSETMIIFTSNIGSSTVEIGKGEELIRNKFIEAVRDHFTNKLNRPEILNRIGEHNIVPFNFINKNIVASIVESKMKNIQKVISEKHKVELVFEKHSLEDIQHLIEEKTDLKMGGRGIVSSIDVHFISRLSDFMFENIKQIKDTKIKNEITTINSYVKNDQVNFKII